MIWVVGDSGIMAAATATLSFGEVVHGHWVQIMTEAAASF